MTDPEKILGKIFCVGCGSQIGAQPGSPTFDLGLIRCCPEGKNIARACFDCFTAIWSNNEEVRSKVLEKIHRVDRSFKL